MSHWISDGPTSLSNYLDSKQRGVTGAKRGAIKWAINRDVTLGEGTLHYTWMYNLTFCVIIAVLSPHYCSYDLFTLYVLVD